MVDKIYRTASEEHERALERVFIGGRARARGCVTLCVCVFKQVFRPKERKNILDPPNLKVDHDQETPNSVSKGLRSRAVEAGLEI